MDSVIPVEIAESSEPVALFGHARPLPGQESRLRALLQSFVAPTRQEPGSVAYHLHADPQQPGVLAFYEHWTSGHDLAERLRLPEMQAFLHRRHELLDGDLEITFLRPLEP